MSILARRRRPPSAIAMAAWFRAASFPCTACRPPGLGRATSAGGRAAGPWGQRPVTTALSLGHGDPLTDQGSQLRVEVRVERVDAERVPTVLSESRRHLAEDLWLAAASQAPDAAERWERIVGARRRPDPTWSQVTIPVDGRLVDFEWMGEGRRWVARAEVDDRTLTLHGRDPPVESVELVRVSELEPYIQGQRRLQEAWARTTTRSTSRTGPLAVLSGWHLATPANRRGPRNWPLRREIFGLS
jgi:hypothetical protein